MHRHDCANNLKHIGIALCAYHDAFGSFPPAYVADENGKPMHSWRVLILPFLDESVRHDWPFIQQSLHTKYSFDEAWDGPRNSSLADEIPRCRSSKRLGYFRCWEDTANECETSYLAVVGQNTAWPSGQVMNLDKIPSPSETILVVEVVNSHIKWSEPRDLPVTEAARRIGDVQQSRQSGRGASILFADGSVLEVTNRMLQSPEFRKMFLVDGGDSQQE